MKDADFDSRQRARRTHSIQSTINLSRVGIVLVMAFVWFFTAAPPRAQAADITTDVTFAVALRDLAASGFDSKQQVLMRDTFPGRPFYTPAFRSRQIALELQADMIIVGFGNEMATAVERVLKVGGFGTAAKVVGLIKDFATARNSAELFEKTGIRALKLALDKVLEKQGIPQTTRDKLIKEALVESMKKVHANSKAGKMKFTRTAQPGFCKGGKETTTVEVDMTQGIVTYRIDAVGCQCNGNDSLKSYHAEVIGAIDADLDLSSKTLSWRFSLVSARYWGESCSERHKKLIDHWKKVYFPTKTSGEPATPVAADPCQGVNPDSLIELMVAHESLIKQLMCRKMKLESDNRQDSDEYDRIKERLERLGAGQNALLSQYVECGFGGSAGKRPPQAFIDILTRCGRGPYKFPPKSKVKGTCSDKAATDHAGVIKGRAIARSVFVGSFDGWSISGDAREFKAHAGYISARDKGSGRLWYFKAPAKFLGDKSRAYGCGLTFELNQIKDGAPTFQWEVVRISDGTLDLIHRNPKPSGGWVRFAVPFEASAWKHRKSKKAVTEADLKRVLSNLKLLLINCEHTTQHETGGLRNVVMYGQ